MRALAPGPSVPGGLRDGHRRVTCTAFKPRLLSGDLREVTGKPAADGALAVDGPHKRLCSILVSTLCSCAIVLSPAGPALSASDGPVTIRFPASRNPEIRSAQEILVQAWGYVREYYFDSTYNNQDWKQQLQDALALTFKAGSRDEALRVVDLLLASLGDPFTRVLLPGGASEAFDAQTQAKVISTGLVAGRLGSADGPLQVAYVVPGSPAAAAGLREGDTIVAVNGRPVVPQADTELLKEQLRQDKEVQLKILRAEPASASAALGTDPAARRDGAATSGRTYGRRAAIRAAAIASGGAASDTASEVPLAAAAAVAAAVGPPAQVIGSSDVTDQQPADAGGSGDHGNVAGSSSNGASALVSGSVAPAGGVPVVPRADLGEAASAGAEPLLAGTSARRTTAPDERSVAGGGSGGDAASPPVAPKAAAGSAPEPPSSSASYPLSSRFIDVHLQPAPVEFLPVQYAVLTRPELEGGRGGGRLGASASTTGLRAQPETGAEGPSPVPVPASPARVGYIRIVAFTENVAKEVDAAIAALKAAGCGSWLLDVRDNPGGIVREGLAVAELMMRPGEVFAVVRDRSGGEQVERLADDARALLDGQPLAILVDRYSASTSELLAGALRDDVRAVLVGERTYGKGRTQRVVQLNGGVTLLLSTDTYMTPARRVVDRVGLAPDVACRPGPPPPPVARPVPSASVAAGEGVGGERLGSGGSAGGADVPRAGIEVEQVDELLRDPCVRAAVGKLTRGTLPRKV